MLFVCSENWDKSDPKKYPTGYHEPPDDVGANFFPSLGAYSSRLVLCDGYNNVLIQNRICGVENWHLFKD